MAVNDAKRYLVEWTGMPANCTNQRFAPPAQPLYNFRPAPVLTRQPMRNQPCPSAHPWRLMVTFMVATSVAI